MVSRSAASTSAAPGARAIRPGVCRTLSPGLGEPLVSSMVEQIPCGTTVGRGERLVVDGPGCQRGGRLAAAIVVLGPAGAVAAAPRRPPPADRSPLPAPRTVHPGWPGDLGPARRA